MTLQERLEPFVGFDAAGSARYDKHSNRVTLYVTGMLDLKELDGISSVFLSEDIEVFSTDKGTLLVTVESPDPETVGGSL